VVVSIPDEVLSRFHPAPRSVDIEAQQVEAGDLLPDLSIQAPIDSALQDISALAAKLAEAEVELRALRQRTEHLDYSVRRSSDEMRRTARA